MRIDTLKGAILDIVSSPNVEEYLIGITQNVTNRYAAYQHWGYRHLAVLRDSLSSSDALKLEKMLQMEKSKDKCGILYRKYDPRVRDGDHRGCLGGPPARRAVYSVYVAWK
jgi:hypothetical protein